MEDGGPPASQPPLVAPATKSASPVQLPVQQGQKVPPIQPGQQAHLVKLVPFQTRVLWKTRRGGRGSFIKNK